MNMITVGMDLSDKKIEICVMDIRGEILEKGNIANSKKAIEKFVKRYRKTEICAALETGTHSPWISRFLESLGCDVIVANARKIKSIWANERKSDSLDAEMLARLARFDRKLLYPIKHNSEENQADLAIIKARDLFVRTRTKCITSARGLAKSFGVVFPKCDADAFGKKAGQHVPKYLQPALLPVIDEIKRLTEKIKKLDKVLLRLQKKKYPETEKMMQIDGVGPVTALAFHLTVESSDRFKKSRSVGAFFGIVPKRDQSGESDKQLGINKSGNKYLRQLLVNCAQHILGPRGKDCEIRRAGQRIMARGGKIAKKKAVTAVARKLAVLMHKLWKTGDVYDPFYNSKGKKKLKAVA